MKRAGLFWITITLVSSLLVGCTGQPAPSLSEEGQGIEQSVSEDTQQIENSGQNAESGNSAEGSGGTQEEELTAAEFVASLLEKEDIVVTVNTEMEKLTASELVSQMNIGWSLGNTLDSTNGTLLKTSKATAWETAWGNPVTTEELIHTVIDRGFNVIRIPVSWNDHLLPGSDYEIVGSWMNRVQEIVDYAYNHGAYVILNIHHESWHMPYHDNKEKGAEILAKVWIQIADRFKDYGERLVFEGMNEPRKVGTNVEWNGGDKEGWEVVNYFNNVFIETIRQSGGNNPYRILMIPAYAANCWEGIKHLEVPEGDDKLVVSVHAYEPYNFALNVKGSGVWNNDTNTIDTIMKNLDTLFVSKGTPVILGEFGAMYKPHEKNLEERAAWAEYYVRAAKEVGIPCCWWDNGAFEGDGELFGLIDRETYEWKFEAVVEGLMKGLE